MAFQYALHPYILSTDDAGDYCMSNWTLQVVGLYSWVLFSFFELLLLQAHPSRGLQALKTLKDNKPSIIERNKRIFFFAVFQSVSVFCTALLRCLYYTDTVRRYSNRFGTTAMRSPGSVLRQAGQF